MNCKNCQTNLITEDKFCTKCGAKVINHKLTFSTITEEFFATFISWDNKFLKTFTHLFTKPEKVAIGYLNGIRKRYMRPFPYIIIALTIYGIYIYFGKEQLYEYMEYISSTMQIKQSGNPEQDKLLLDLNKKISDYTINYFNVLTFIMIPFLAVFNLILFRKNNFIEHCVLLLYSYGHYMYTFVFCSLISLVFSIPLKYTYPITIIFMLVYHMYFYKRLYRLSVLKIIYKTILYWILLLSLYIIIGILGFIIGYFILSIS